MKAEHLAIAGMNRSTAYNIQSWNINTARQQEAAVHPDKKAKGRDRVMISPLQRANNMIATLREQKEGIVKAKSELAKYARETGKDYEAIKPQMENYDNMLEELDRQIASVYNQQSVLALEQAEKTKEKKPNRHDEEKTEEQLETERMSNLASATDSAKETQALAAHKDKAEGETKAKESEVKIEEVWIDYLESKGRFPGVDIKYGLSNVRRFVSAKKEAIPDLDEKIARIDKLQTDTLLETRTLLEESQNTNPNPPSEEELRDQKLQEEKAEAPVPPAAETLKKDSKKDGLFIRIAD